MQEDEFFLIPRTAYELNDLKIVGCTLWSHVSESVSRSVERTWNDYTNITLLDGASKRKIKYTDTNDWYKGKREFSILTIPSRLGIHKRRVKCISEEKAKSYSVLASLSSLQVWFAKTFLKISAPGAGTDLTKIFTKNLILWCFGHTHHSSDDQVSMFSRVLAFFTDSDKTRVISNQLGYEYTMPDGVDEEFWTEYVIDIDKEVALEFL